MKEKFFKRLKRKTLSIISDLIFSHSPINIDDSIDSVFTSYGQDEKDMFLDTCIFKGFKNGYFVDVGAHDGITFNNTYRFEKYYDWSGINIEPIPSVFKTLVQNRPKSQNLNVAISDRETISTFIESEADMESGLVESMDPVQLEIINQRTGSKKFSVKTQLLKDILNEYEIKNINLLSIDVEGAEVGVIKSIDFDEVFIDVIMFESNDYYETTKEKNKEILKYLHKKNFFVFRRSGDIYLMNFSSKFNKYRKKNLRHFLIKLFKIYEFK